MRSTKRIYVWDEPTMQLLRDNYPTKSPGELRVLFPGKTMKQIQIKAKDIGICKEEGYRSNPAKRMRLFTTDQQHIIKTMYANTKTAELLTLLPGFSRQQIALAAARFGIKKEVKSAGGMVPNMGKLKFTDAEVELLKTNYEKEPITKLQAMFPGRTWKQISTKARTYGLRRDVSHIRAKELKKPKPLPKLLKRKINQAKNNIVENKPKFGDRSRQEKQLPKFETKEIYKGNPVRVNESTIIYAKASRKPEDVKADYARQREKARLSLLRGSSKWD